MNKLFRLLPLAAALGLAACGGQSAGSGDKAAAGNSAACGKLAADEECVTIGTGSALSGGIAHWGKDLENGATLAVQDINAKGGLVINGKKIKLALVAEDDAGDPKQGTVVAQKLADSNVVAVVGHLTSGVCIPASTVYSAAGMVSVSPSCTNPDYTLKSAKTPKGSVSTYRVVATDAQQSPALAKFILAHGGKNIAVLDDSTQYGKGLADEVVKNLKEGGANITNRESTSDKTIDFKAVLTNIKEKNPDYIFWGGMDDTASALVKQMRELGIQAKLIGADGICTDKFIELAGENGKGAMCSQLGLPLSQMAKGKEFSAEFEKAFAGKKPLLYSPFAYDATYAIAEAMKLANSTDREAIAAAMPKVKFDGVIGPIAFDGKGDIQNGTVSMFEVKDGKLNIVEVMK